MTQEELLMEDYSEDAATFGDRLALARESQNLTQEHLAKRLGLRVQTVQNWEFDRSEPRANKLQMLAGMLGVSIMWILTGEGDGLDGPEMGDDLPDEMADLLSELRKMKVDQARMAERMGRLEKRLRLAVAGRV